jgi:hypothetical protein
MAYTFIKVNKTFLQHIKTKNRGNFAVELLKFPDERLPTVSRGNDADLCSEEI